MRPEYLRDNVAVDFARGVWDRAAAHRGRRDDPRHLGQRRRPSHLALRQSRPPNSATRLRGSLLGISSHF